MFQGLRRHGRQKRLAEALHVMAADRAQDPGLAPSRRGLAVLQCKRITNQRHRPSPNLYPNIKVEVAHT
jgi:hypothetical protein